MFHLIFILNLCKALKYYLEKVHPLRIISQLSQGHENHKVKRIMLPIDMIHIQLNYNNHFHSSLDIKCCKINNILNISFRCRVYKINICPM